MLEELIHIYGFGDFHIIECRSGAVLLGAESHPILVGEHHHGGGMPHCGRQIQLQLAMREMHRSSELLQVEILLRFVIRCCDVVVYGEVRR
jgi:hypothetical protein